MKKIELLNIILGLQDRESFLKSKINGLTIRASGDTIDMKYFKSQLEVTIQLIKQFKKEYTNNE